MLVLVLLCIMMRDYLTVLISGELIYVAEVRSGTHVTQLDDQLADEISKYLDTDEEKELFEQVKKQEFQFVLFLYKDLISKRKN